MNNIIDLEHEVVRHWTRGESVLFSHWNQLEGNLKVVTKMRTKMDGCEFTLLRFFYLRKKVECSIDICKSIPEFFITKLFNSYENK